MVLALASVPTFARAQADASLKNEVQAAIDRGLAYLKGKQAEDGSFGDAKHPAFTALAVSAMMGNPAQTGSPSVAVLRGYDFLLSKQKPDGGFYTEGMANYNTCLSVTALTMVGHIPKYREAALKAKPALIGNQYDEGEKGKMDGLYDGGIGYGSKPPSDMSNTHFGLEALYHLKKLAKDEPEDKNAPKLNYQAAIDFVSRCQNLPSTNKSSWVTGDERNKGGFVYRPGESKAPEDKTADGKVALRSYASMGYAGLLSFIYADVQANDPRVVAVKQWLAENYSVTENPGIGQEGLYYYYHTMAKALNLSGMDTLTTADGKAHNWRLDLSKQLFNTQKEDGSWANENGRWMEKDSILVTAYAVLALEHVVRKL